MYKANTENYLRKAGNNVSYSYVRKVYEKENIRGYTSFVYISKRIVCGNKYFIIDTPNLDLDLLKVTSVTSLKSREPVVQVRLPACVSFMVS